MEHVKTFPVFEATVTDHNDEKVASYHVAAESFDQAEKIVENIILGYRISLARYYGEVDMNKWQFGAPPDDFLPGRE